MASDGSRCLIILKRHGERILNGEKTVEVRGTPAREGWIWLTFSGPVHDIRGRVYLTHCDGPIDFKRFEETRGLHLVQAGQAINGSPSDQSLPYKETYLWHLKDAQWESRPHTRKRGQVVWATPYNGPNGLFR